MELKKNPAQDIHRKSAMFFQLGLGISIALVITAFEWRTEYKKVQPRTVNPFDDTIALSPVTEIQPKEPPLPSPIKNEVPPGNDFTAISTETTTEASTEANEVTLDPELISSTPIEIPIEPNEICYDCPFLTSETPPTPIDGLEGFYATVRNKLKYPRQAQQMGVEGKVTVEFVINRDGSPTEFNVISGIGGGCDEEAKRVLAMTRWNPGKQRGKPVRVKMVMPIFFKLNGF